MKSRALLFAVFSIVLPPSAMSADQDDPCKAGAPWYMQKAPTAPDRESSTYIVLNAKAPIGVQICYCTGKEDTYVWVRANSPGSSGEEPPKKPAGSTPDKPAPRKSRLAADGKAVGFSGGTWVSQLFAQSSILASGTSVWLANPNDQPARGRFQVQK
jgi:hypothetical protein